MKPLVQVKLLLLMRRLKSKKVKERVKGQHGKITSNPGNVNFSGISTDNEGYVSKAVGKPGTSKDTLIHLHRVSNLQLPVYHIHFRIPVKAQETRDLQTASLEMM